MDKNFSTLFQDIKEDLTNYVNLKLKLFQLELIEKAGVTTSLLFYGLILLFVVFFVVLFLFLALGMFLGEVLHSYALGMGLVALLYLFVLFFLFYKRVRIQSWLIDVFLKELLKNDEENGSENK